MPTPRQQRALRGCLQINTFHPLPPQRLQFLSYRSVALARIPHSTTAAILLQARRNLITQKNENLKSADNISTHLHAGAVLDVQKNRSGEVIDLGREGQI